VNNVIMKSRCAVERAHLAVCHQCSWPPISKAHSAKSKAHSMFAFMRRACALSCGSHGITVSFSAFVMQLHSNLRQLEDPSLLRATFRQVAAWGRSPDSWIPRVLVFHTPAAAIPCVQTRHDSAVAFQWLLGSIHSFSNHLHLSSGHLWSQGTGTESNRLPDWPAPRVLLCCSVHTMLDNQIDEIAIKCQTQASGSYIRKSRQIRSTGTECTPSQYGIYLTFCENYASSRALAAS
jgi:hypothetical protein